ncbi:hypothetical protein D3C87_670790 [compost metagenome]
MRMTSRLALVLTLLLPLSGCELLLVSPTLPGIAPFVGRPLTGKVVDSVTGLPLGNATVTAGLLATAKTDADGSFKLYGNIGGQGIAIARAGYTSLSYVTNSPLADGQSYFLPPLFPATGLPSAKHVTLQGVVHYNGAPITPKGAVVFAGLASTMTTTNGQFALAIRELLPGSVHSGVLAGGILIGGPISSETNQSAADFSFDSFGYRFADIPFADKPDLAPLPLQPIESKEVPIQSLSVNYSNAGAFSQVQTDVIMDFGLMGSVPVARNSQSNKTIPVPYVQGIKYAIEGRASDASGKLTSRVSVVTNSLSPVPFRLMSPPVVTSPANGAEEGGNPTFSWDPVPDAQSYAVEVFEGTHASATLKWKGYTSQTSIAFPTFPDWDMNGGSLIPGISYTWTVRAYNATVESLGKAVTAPPPSKPYRTNLYESAASGMTFSRVR